MWTAKVGYIVLSAALCAVGAGMILRPSMSVSLISAVVGAMLVAFGVVKLVAYFSRDLYRLAFQFDLAFGILLIAMGALFLLRRARAMNALCVILGIEIAADGLFKIQTALDARRFGLPAWGLIFTLAVISGLAGAFLVLQPAQGARALTELLGASLAAEGVLNLCVAVSAVKIIRHQQADGPEMFPYSNRKG